MTSKRELLRQQRKWAKASGLAPDSRGYLESAEENLFQPLSEKALADFTRGSGSELEPTPHRPAKMCALHSSAALVVNFFDHWQERDATPLAEALGLKSSIESLSFEAQFPTGLRGTPPNLDIALALADGSVVGIESKFTEWMTPKRKNRPPFKEKYFVGETSLWTGMGLPRCQALAEDLMRAGARFVYLDAPQLLKHALGLAKQIGDRSSLLYLYYDLSDDRGRKHREEITLFADRIDAVLEFRSLSYQELHRRLRDTDAADDRYLAYLNGRYFERPSNV